MDTALAQGARLVMASVWWSDVDRSPARPAAPQEARYDFAPLDAVMDYAARRKAQVVLKTSANHFPPGWRLAELGFPQGAGYQERLGLPVLQRPTPTARPTPTRAWRCCR